MKIQSLLETDLYRYQHEWETKTDPVIQVPARAGRESSDKALIAYGAYYALTKLKVKVPRRWNSSFATSAPDKSLFMNTLNRKGIRKVVITDNRPCGFVHGDFNEFKYDNFKVDQIGYNIGDYFHKLKDRSRVQEIQIKLIHSGLSEFLGTRQTSDAGYQDFLGLVTRMDKLLKSYELPTFTQRVVDVMKAFVDKGAIGATTLKKIPEGNYEVWFEGPYDAQITTEFEDDEDEQHDFDR